MDPAMKSVLFLNWIPLLLLAAVFVMIRIEQERNQREIDALRLLWRVLSEEDVAAERAACVIAPDPVELHWSMSVLIDGVPFARRDLGAGEARSWTDFWAPVRQITGTHRVAFRLSLETVVEPELPS